VGGEEEATLLINPFSEEGRGGGEKANAICTSIRTARRKKGGGKKSGGKKE